MSLLDCAATSVLSASFVHVFPNIVFGRLGFTTRLQWYASMIPLSVAAGSITSWITGTKTQFVTELDRHELNVSKVLLGLSIVTVFVEAARVKL